MPLFLEPTEVCDDCGASDGALHDLYCTRERCPFCGNQLICCDCLKSVLQLTPEEAAVVDEYVDDSIEPLKGIIERWTGALTKKGRIPFRGRKLQPMADDLILMAARGELDAVRRLLARGVPVDALNKVNHTALLSAAASGQLPMVELLLKQGANILHRNVDGFTALHCALNHPAGGERQLATVALLLKKGAEANARSNSGGTPLMNAAWFGALAAVKLLLEAGADRSARDDKGKDAADLALQKGHSEIATLLRSTR